MTLDTLRHQFSLCKSWEERYRLLIQLSRELPKPDEETLANWQEIHGCESRLWVHLGATPQDFKAYSDARLMQGILRVVMLAVQEQQPILPLLEELQIKQTLSATRLNALEQITAQIAQNYA